MTFQATNLQFNEENRTLTNAVLLIWSCKCCVLASSAIIQSVMFLDWSHHHLNVFCNSWTVKNYCVHLRVLGSHCRSGRCESSWHHWLIQEAFWHWAWDNNALEGPQYDKEDHKEHYDEDHKPLPVPMKTQESQQPVSTTLSSLLSPRRLFCFMLTNVNADTVRYHWVWVAQPLSI